MMRMLVFMFLIQTKKAEREEERREMRRGTVMTGRVLDTRFASMLLCGCLNPLLARLCAQCKQPAVATTTAPKERSKEGALLRQRLVVKVLRLKV